MEEKNLNTTTQENSEPKKEDSKAEVQEQKKDVPETQDKKNEPSVQELMVELAKLKRAQEKAASEAADYKQKWKQSLSEKEQIDMEKAEAQAKRDEEFESLKRKVAINDLVSNYMDREFPKDVAYKIAEAQIDGDIDTVNTIEKQMDEEKHRKWEADFLKSRPEINTGAGNTPTLTKEQFEKMSLIERSKLKRENEAEYNRLLSL